MLKTKSQNGKVDLSAYTGIRLDIGCGANKQAGYVGMDIRPLPGVDIVQDLEEFPWPLEDESVLTALASHVIEHINPHKGVFLKFMDEVWRVMKPGGQFAIAVPHGASPGFLQDPTHCNPCNEATFFYFDPEHPSGLWNIYKPKPWKIEQLYLGANMFLEVLLVKRD